MGAGRLCDHRPLPVRADHPTRTQIDREHLIELDEHGRRRRRESPAVGPERPARIRTVNGTGREPGGQRPGPRPARAPPGRRDPATRRRSRHVANSSPAAIARRKPTLVVRPRIAVRSSASTRRSSRRLPIRPGGDDLAEHRVVLRGHLLAALQGLIDPDPRSLRPAHERRRARLREETRRTGPRRRCALRSRARTGPARPRRGRARSPAATRSCSSTRSSPPQIASVTGCSTWRRVFISRK